MSHDGCLDCRNILGSHKVDIRPYYVLHFPFDGGVRMGRNVSPRKKLDHCYENMENHLLKCLISQ